VDQSALVDIIRFYAGPAILVGLFVLWWAWSGVQVREIDPEQLQAILEEDPR
jgi:uncharacterized membrane protein (DUF441 family)